MDSDENNRKPLKNYLHPSKTFKQLKYINNISHVFIHKEEAEFNRKARGTYIKMNKSNIVIIRCKLLHLSYKRRKR